MLHRRHLLCSDRLLQPDTGADFGSVAVALCLMLTSNPELPKLPAGTVCKAAELDDMTLPLDLPGSS